mmetsp:Transcript_27011/g.89663  ORF Transcript_27011/g.89663 Transcript_27011/m.89663 type:complete len:106 (+) Transcript_27011:1805-2122(+)
MHRRHVEWLGRPQVLHLHPRGELLPRRIPAAERWQLHEVSARHLERSVEDRRVEWMLDVRSRNEEHPRLGRLRIMSRGHLKLNRLGKLLFLHPGKIQQGWLFALH